MVVPALLRRIEKRGRPWSNDFKNDPHPLVCVKYSLGDGARRKNKNANRRARRTKLVIRCRLPGVLAPPWWRQAESGGCRTGAVALVAPRDMPLPLAVPYGVPGHCLEQCQRQSRQLPACRVAVWQLPS